MTTMMLLVPFLLLGVLMPSYLTSPLDSAIPISEDTEPETVPIGFYMAYKRVDSPQLTRHEARDECKKWGGDLFNPRSAWEFNQVKDKYFQDITSKTNTWWWMFGGVTYVKNYLPEDWIHRKVHGAGDCLAVQPKYEHLWWAKMVYKPLSARDCTTKFGYICGKKVYV